MTRFYVSARFGRQEEARHVAEKVTRATGWECTARWLTDTPENDQAIHEDRAAMLAAAKQDIDDIRAADIMFCLTEDLREDDTRHLDIHGEVISREVPASWARGGRHVEVGYAITRIPVILIGPRENVFHGLCVAVDSMAGAVEAARRETGEGQ